MKEENSKVQSASEALRILVESRDESKMTKREIVLLLKKDIVKARAAGKTWKEIVEVLRSVGVEITAPHVKACIQGQNKSSDKKSKSDKSLVKPLEKPTDIIVAGQNKIRPATQNL